MYLLFGTIFVQDQNAQSWLIAVQSSPSVIALASSAFVDALAVSTATALARMCAGTFDLHETDMTSTLIRCLALAVVAILAMRHACASVSRSILKDDRGSRCLCSESEIREDEPVVAFADLGRYARAVAAVLTYGLASADFRVSMAVETRASVRRRACAVAAFDATDRLAFERDVFRVVINHAITVLADAEIRRLADTVCFADRMTDRIARVRLIR